VNTQAATLVGTRSRIIFLRSGTQCAYLSQPRASLCQGRTIIPQVPEAALKRCPIYCGLRRLQSEQERLTRSRNAGNPNIQKAGITTSKDATGQSMPLAVSIAVADVNLDYRIVLDRWQDKGSTDSAVLSEKAHWIDAACVGEVRESSQA